MREFLNILKDIKSGALPASELPAFVLWLLAKPSWLWFVLLVIVLAIWLGR